jgi:putative transcriptional regulator
MIHCHLATLLAKNRLTAAELARLAEVNRSTVSALVKQRATRIDLEAIERICGALGCRVGDLLEIVPDSPASNASESSKWQ